MARKKKVPKSVADEPSAVPPTEDAELAELAELAGESADSTPPPTSGADLDADPNVEPGANPDDGVANPAEKPQNEPKDGAATDSAAKDDEELSQDDPTPSEDAAGRTPETTEDDPTPAEDAAESTDETPAEDDPTPSQGTAEPTDDGSEVTPAEGDDAAVDQDDSATDTQDPTADEEAIEEEAIADELAHLDDVPDDADELADDPMDDAQAPFDDDLDLPWMDTEEAELTESTSAAFVPVPVSPASPADTTYPPPPPYDPSALPKTRRRTRSDADNPDSPPSGADYMLADAMGGGPKKVRRTPLLIGAAVLVLALIGGIVWAAPTLFPGMFAPARNATPKAAVETYLNALAAGDASTALKAAVTPPTETSLLTNEVLAASQRRAPITNIVVKDASGSSSAVVPVTYQLGGKPVTASFPTQKIGNEWRLVTITRDVQLAGIDHVSVTLNGVPVTEAAHLTLFPGSYLLASANDRLSVTGGEFLVQSPSDFANPTLSATLSDKGIADARTASQAFLNACVKKKEMTPSGCGFGVDAAGVKVKSVTWQVTSGAKALKLANFKAESSQPYVATVYPYIQLKATVLDSNGRRYTGTDVITVAKADLSGPDVVVTFNQ